MKKYFAIAFVLLLVLLLVLRKQTEPSHFAEVAPISEETLAAAAVPSSPKHSTVAVGEPHLAPPIVAIAPDVLKSLRQQAQQSLMSEFTAQQAQHAEWERYTSDLVFTGWEPSSADIGFKMGFLKALEEKPLESGDQREDSSRMTTDAFINRDTSTSGQKFRYTLEAERIRLQDYARYCSKGCGVERDSFEMLSVVPLDDHGHVDVWLINEKKEAKLVSDGSASN